MEWLMFYLPCCKKTSSKAEYTEVDAIQFRPRAYISWEHLYVYIWIYINLNKILPLKMPYNMIGEILGYSILWNQ